ncbi:Adenylate kinase [[Actinomadura] parvosata subsp. kistnae]|nr:Adenylate kinase [Actinomadura parvosata subsp. kistnae]
MSRRISACATFLGKPVEQEPVLRVVLGQTVTDHGDGDLIGHQVTTVHVRLGQLAKIRAAGDVGTEDVTCRNLRMDRFDAMYWPVSLRSPEEQRRLRSTLLSLSISYRANVSGGTDLGKLAKTYMDRGDLVPDGVTIAMVRDVCRGRRAGRVPARRLPEERRAGGDPARHAQGLGPGARSRARACGGRRRGGQAAGRPAHLQSVRAHLARRVRRQEGRQV